MFLLLENLGYPMVDFNYVLGFVFPALIIVWAISIFFKRQGLLSVVGAIILLFWGISMLGRNMGWFELDMSKLWNIFWPTILILIGVSIIASVKFGAKNNIAFMGGVEKTKTHWELQEDTYTAIMGGIELDLRYAEIPEGQTNIKLTAIMGGIEIVVPDDITVYCKGNVVLGGLEFLKQSSGGIISSLQTEQLGNNKVVKFDGNAIMGGIEIKAKERI